MIVNEISNLLYDYNLDKNKELLKEKLITTFIISITAYYFYVTNHTYIELVFL